MCMLSWPRSYEKLDAVGGRPESAVQNALTWRKEAAVCVVAGLTASYAATWFLIPAKSEYPVGASAISAQFGDYANNLTQLVCLFSMIGFLAAMFPDDVDSVEARKYTLPLLAVSNVCDTYVIVGAVLAYDTSEVERATRDQRICMYIYFSVCAFTFVWGVLFATWVILTHRGTWAMLRSGLCVDAAFFWCAIAALWWHGETVFPPGDASLHAALLGRPAIGLLAAAIFGHGNRRRLAAGLAAIGFFHVRVPLSNMRHDEIYAVLGHVDYGTPIASGNLISSSVLMTETETVTSDVDTLAAPRSHHTAKLGC